MDHLDSPMNILTFASWLLSLILDANASHTLELAGPATTDDDDDDPLLRMVHNVDAPVIDMFSFLSNTLHKYRLCSISTVFDEDVSYWVKPRSTTWFSRFLLQEYDNTRWVSMFRMTKPSIFALAELLKPHVEKKNTKYRLAIPVLVRVACTLFKLVHAANFTICSEMFAVGCSTVSKALREVVHAINDVLAHEISWPTGNRVREIQENFTALCSLPGIVGAIDGMHVSISKPSFGAADYFYFKSGGYTVNCQAVVDSEKRFLDLYVGMPGSTNDSRMLRRSSLHYLASHGNLMDATYSVHGQTPYLIGDQGFPLLPWLMVPHRGREELSVSECLFNMKLQKGRCIVENSFGILKQTFRELLCKSELHLTFLPDVIVCCAILHNVLLRQSHEEVQNLLEVLQTEGLEGDIHHDEVGVADGIAGLPDDMVSEAAKQKRDQLGIYLTTQRRHFL